MELVVTLILLVLNLAISFWNAKVAGWAWVETKHAGGWRRFMVWMGAAMSAIGFTWCYLIILVFLGYATGNISGNAAMAALQLGYILIIPGVIFVGTMIMIDSWANAYRNRSVASFGVAGYNTFANVYNTYNAIKTVPDALDNVLDFFKGGGRDKDKLLVLLLVIVAALSGVITTWIIVTRTAANDAPMPARQEYA